MSEVRCRHFAGTGRAQAVRCCSLPLLNIALVLCSAISFLGFGLACFFSGSLKQEFNRYGVGALRAMIGGLQLCGALGLLAGLSQPWMGRTAAACLSMMMLVGVGIRIKIKDSLLQTTPTLFYVVLNAYLCLVAF